MEELERTFDFGKKSSYSATKNLARIRSSKYKRVKAPARPELWNRPAPDLRMQLYHPHPLPRNSREAIQPWKYTASFDADKVRIRFHFKILSGILERSFFVSLIFSIYHIIFKILRDIYFKMYYANMYIILLDTQKINDIFTRLVLN